MEEISKIIVDRLKAMYNIALNHINKEEYFAAEKIFADINTLCQNFHYDGGVYMANRSLANLLLMQNRNVEAFYAMDIAYKKCDVKEDGAQLLIYLKKLSLEVLKVSLDFQKQGALSAALDGYNAILPYLGEKRKTIVAKEINFLKKRLKNEH